MTEIAHHVLHYPIISNRNRFASPLLRLPPEIRLEIYTHVILSSIKPHDYYQRPGRTMGARPDYIQHMKPWVVPRYSGLLLTCRQTYDEAHLLPFELLALLLGSEEGRCWWHNLSRKQKGGFRNLRLIVSLDGPSNGVPSLDLSFFDTHGPAIWQLRGFLRIYVTIRHQHIAWEDRETELKTQLTCAVQIVRDMAREWAKERLGREVRIKVEARGLEKLVQSKEETASIAPA